MEDRSEAVGPWRITTTDLPGRSIRSQIVGSAGVPSYAQVANSWWRDGEFRSFFCQALAEVPFDAYLWETPPVTSANLDRPFEFVLIDSPALARFRPDPVAFAEHFEAGRDVVDFPNLGGDAHLVAPCPVADLSSYIHLGAFVRDAPPEQVHRFWERVGSVFRDRVGPRPTWLSTCGLGAGWLHARFDSSPKYYRHTPFRHLD